MKQIRGIWLPDSDTHFEAHLLAGPEFEGAGTYQWKKIHAALSLVEPGRRRRAIDVGAHVGLWSRVLARHFQHVLAFEPVPELVECFRANVAHLDNVELIQNAVGDDTGSLTMTIIPDNTGNCRVAPAGGEYGEQQMVRVVRLDDVFSGDKPVSIIDFIKIDVEGWELQVVQGGEQLIKRDHPIMVVEQKPGNAERYGQTRTAAVDLLRSWGAVVLWEKAGDFCLGWE